MPRCVQKSEAVVTPPRSRLTPKMISQNPSYMLRYVRQVAERGEKLTRRELVLISDHLATMHVCPLEELTREFTGILLSPTVLDSFQLMIDSGLLGVLIPELLRGKGMKQSYIHPDDVLTHNLFTCSLVKPTLHLRLAGLLHDVGKPDYYVEDPRVGRRFPNHSHRSAILVPIILGRFSYSAKLVERVKILVANHMFIWLPHHGPEPIRGLVGQVGKENIEDLIELITCDRRAIWGEKIRECNKALWEALATVITSTEI